MAWATIVCCVAGWLVLSPLVLRLDVHVEKLTLVLTVRVNFTGFHKEMAWQVPAIASEVDSPPSPRLHLSMALIQRVIGSLRRFDALTASLWRRMRVTRFDLTCRIGIGDAANTALLVGHLDEALAWWVQARIAPRSVLSPSWAVEPIWDTPGFDLNFTSIIQVRASDIILGVVSTLSHTKGGGDRRDGDP